jgi:hypothetical protein
MQYTESNLGIPDERFEYLARVAKWLVSDWATAQGHPPDPLRPVYGRVLSRMAFYLHSNNTSECPLPQAIALVKSWLPNFGLDESKAEELIRSIAIKTGILVSEGNNTFIFAQFGLQEYFASLELQERISADKVAELEPKAWWREVILLSTAQMRNPTPLLNALFVNSPLLAATAVAECPTPPTEMQERAIVACLDGVDRKDGAAAAAVVPLLRKISAPLEQRLCAALEERLYKEEEIASLVGRCLATAGTAAATNVLGQHPEIWDKCLSEAGYLSSTFENMLVDLIRDGNDQQSGRAAELITTRLSNDRFVELTNLLPVLAPAKSEHLASLLLRHVEETAEPEFYYAISRPESFILWVISRCAPHVRNREGYLKMREVRRSERQDVYRRYRYRLGSEFGDIVSTALFLERKHQRYNSDQILNFLANSVKWARMRSAILCWLCAAVVSIATDLGSTMRAFVSIPALLIVTFCSTYPRGNVPWLPHRVFAWEGNVFTGGLLLLAGALITLSLTMSGNYIFKGPVEVLSQMGLALCCSLAGFATRGDESLVGYFVEDVPAPARRTAGIQLHAWSSLAFTLFLVACIASFLFISNLPVVMVSLILISAVFLLWLSYIVIMLNYSRRTVQKATKQAGYLMARIRP